MQEECRLCVLDKQLGRHPADADPALIEEYQNAVREITGRKQLSAPEAVYHIRKVRERLFDVKEKDFTEIKKHYNALMLSREEAMMEEIHSASDPLRMALQLSMAANYIDFSALRNVNEDDLVQLMGSAGDIPLDENIFRILLSDLADARHLAFLTDNCGEIVADKCLIRILLEMYPSLSASVIVRGAPVANDVTMEDAEQTGLTEICRVMGSGSPIDGTIFEALSDEARDTLNAADVIMAKGQANYETLSGCGLNVYYLFMCKCHLFTRRFNVPRFSGILTRELL